ncbi:MAG: ribulose-phosphate 3-epimerase [Armatimonadetes bacterium]|nr:ribulose-phosphate 3-epimerase [Armatimonadota bacterium]
MKISPSLLSADFSNLERAVRQVTEGGADSLHLDIMDGRFVPNITFGPLVVRSIRSKTDLPFCGHLMIIEPESILAEFIAAGCDTIIIHAEACAHLHRTLQQIRELGATPGVALNPSTPLCVIENVLSEIDELLIMTVNPGFGGQDFIPEMLPKIKAARAMIENAGRKIDISVDGGINTKTCELVTAAGANVLVAGSFVFNGPECIEKAISDLRRHCREV